MEYSKMKKVLISAALMLISALSFAQNYKPLKQIEVPENLVNRITIHENKPPVGHTYYTASFLLYTRGISAQLGVPAKFDFFIKDNEIKLPQKTQALVSIGGESYYMYADKIDDMTFIDIVGDHVKHIAVSGMQYIEFKQNGELLHRLDFTEIEQELWRRAAIELKNTVEIFKIL